MATDIFKKCKFVVKKKNHDGFGNLFTDWESELCDVNSNEVKRNATKLASPKCQQDAGMSGINTCRNEQHMQTAGFLTLTDLHY